MVHCRELPGLLNVCALENGNLLWRQNKPPQVLLPKHPRSDWILLRILDFFELAALHSPLKQGACLLWKVGIMSNENLTF